MKIKILKLLTMVLILTGSLYSCNKKETHENIPIQSLEGTKWKLKGIVDTKGKLKELEPKHCKECYTLSFEADYIAKVNSINDDQFWKNQKLDLLNLNPNQSLPFIYVCEKYYEDGKVYCESSYFRTAIYRTESYELTSKYLKLFYNDGNKYYLLFNPLND